ncbi:MAG: hypothetical protein JO086_06210, partial [Acidimicrobiia bacterium]|nr:hypothetical protein [Acidimicrobiia bacterium]
MEACAAAGVDAAGAPPRPWTQEDLLKALAAAAADSDGSFTRAQYRDWRANQADPEAWPGPDRFPHGRSAWLRLCRKAGTQGAWRNRRYIYDDDIIRDALRAAAHGEERLSRSRYVEFTRGADDVPSLNTILLRFPSWPSAC